MAAREIRNVLSDLDETGRGDVFQVDGLVLVQPHLRSPAGIPIFYIENEGLISLLEDVARPSGKGVRVLLAENVANPAAGEDLQSAAALPHPEGHL